MRRSGRTRIGVAATATAVLAVALGVSAVAAQPSPTLPAIAPDALLASTIRTLSSPPTVSGTVRTHIDLGLPELPQLPMGSGASTASPASLLLGDQAFRLWRSPAGVRVAHLDQFEEQLVVVNPTTAWAWDSRTMTAVRLARGDVAGSLREALAGAGATGAEERRAPASIGDPVEVARALLADVRPYAVATLGTPQRIAGRDAYVLDLRPRSTRTLVGDISVAVDAATRLPLRLQVIPRGSVEPSIEIGFTSIDYGAIDPGLFTFTPPAGATVVDAGPALHRAAGAAPAAEEQAREAAPELRVFGKGFGMTVAVRVGRVDPRVRALLPYQGPLASATLADRGDHAWIVAGAVRPSAVASVASSLR